MLEEQITEQIFAHISAPLLPIWGVAIFLFVLLPTSALIGYGIGRRTYVRARREGRLVGAEAGDTTLTATMALLGLLLALTFANAIGWAHERKLAVTAEAAAIGTAFLRTDLVAEPGRSELRRALLDYARTRQIAPGMARTPAEWRVLIARSLATQAALWPTTLDAIGNDTHPAVGMHLSSGVTAVLDAHLRRIAVGTSTMPPIAKALLILAAAVAVGLAGNNSALTGRSFPTRLLLFSGILAFVMYVIFDLDRAWEGVIVLPTAPIEQTITEMEAAMAGAPR